MKLGGHLVAQIAIAIGVTSQMLCQAPPTSEAFLARYGIPLTTLGLTNALKNSHPEVRAIAAGVLAEKKDQAAIPMLQQALTDEKVASVKNTIAESLARLEDWKGSELLVDTCNDSSAEPTIRLQAARKIQDLGSNLCTKSVVMLLDPAADPPTRELALQYLRRAETVPRAILPQMQVLLGRELADPIPMNRQYASECLSVFGGKSAVAELQSALNVEQDAATKLHLQENLHRLQERLYGRQ